MDGHPQKKWTVMVYLAGDNELNDDMAAALKSLHALRGNPGCNIFAYYATANLTRQTALYDFREKIKDDEPLKCSERDRLGSTVATDLGNSADVKSLVDFVSGCLEECRTEHNILILSGHSDSFLGRSLLQDQSSMKVMKFLELKEALRQINCKLGEREIDCQSEGRKLDILGFDSCAMGMIEIAYELRDFAKVLVTPQDFTPASGWNYKEMLDSLAKENPSTEADEHARNFVAEYTRWQTDFVVGGRSVEISACRLDADFETLVGRISDLADLLRVELPPVEPRQESPDDGNYGDDALSNEKPGIMYSRIIDLVLCSHWFAQTHMQDQSVDLAGFCWNLFLQCEKMRRHIAIIKGVKYLPDDIYVDGEGAALFNKLGDIRHLCIQILQLMFGGEKPFIIARGHAGIEHQFSYGLSIFFPWSRMAFIISYDTYKELAFTKRKGESWLSLINRFTAETIFQDYNELLEKAEDGDQNFERSLAIAPFLKEFLIPLDKYDPPNRGALANFREKFGRVKNYPLTWDEPDCPEHPQVELEV